MGWSSVSAGTSAERGRRVRPRVASAGTRRRPPRRMLGSSPRWMRRHTVDRDTPSARPAASTVIRFCGTNGSYHRSSHCLIVSLDGNCRESSGVVPSRGDIVETDLGQQFKYLRTKHLQLELVAAGVVPRATSEGCRSKPRRGADNSTNVVRRIGGGGSRTLLTRVSKLVMARDFWCKGLIPLGFPHRSLFP